MTLNQTLVTTDPKYTIREHLEFLRKFAHRLLIEEDPDISSLESLKNEYTDELLALGENFKLTKRDLMVLIFKEVLPKTIKPIA